MLAEEIRPGERALESDWLSYDEVRSLLSGDSDRLRAYVDESPLRAVNGALDFLVVVRDHDAWYIDGQGWHDANAPVAPSGVGRQMINYYDRTSWSKLPVPASDRIHSVCWDGEAFVFRASRGPIRSTPRQVWLAVQDSITGRALSEFQIEQNFRKLDGSTPLEWHRTEQTHQSQVADEAGKLPILPMNHETLGEIDRDPGGVFDAVATIRYGLHDLKISMSRDDQVFEATLKLAAEVVERLPEIDKLAKGVAVADLRETYNNGWNEYDEAQEDGSLKTVSNPELTEAEFAAKLSLKAVNVTGDRMLDFFYDNERMFWGHSVVVNSLNGIDFSKAQAELFG
jgi:hypothetical protein